MNANSTTHDGKHPNPTTCLMLDAFERVNELMPTVIEDLSVDELLWRPDADANPIAWLLWHLTRVQDSHLADLDGSEQLWVEGGWAEKFALPYDENSVGFGQSSDEVGRFSITDPSLLEGYHHAVHSRTNDIVSQLSDDDYDRVIDDSYDPPVTISTRLVSVVNDTTQHIGQASYVRGLVERRRR